MAVRTDHDCELVAVVEGQQKQIHELLEAAREQAARMSAQETRIERQSREIDQLKKALIGPKTERMKMPSVAEELGKTPGRERGHVRHRAHA